MAVLKQTKVLFSNVQNIDDFSQKYQIVVQLTEEQAADAEAAGLNVKTKEYEGATQFQVTFKSKFRPRIVSRDGQTDMNLDGAEIGRGSLVCVQYKFRDWTAVGGKSGTSADLNAVQVLKLEGSGASEFADEGDAFDDEEADY